MKIQAAIQLVTNQQHLSKAQMRAVMLQVMHGQCSDAQVAGLLIALSMKGETTDEITAAAEIMIELAELVKINDNNAIDIVGTGGDNSHTFNVSTIAAFVIAGAGVTVAKHGNRSVSSKSGSADLLEALGANVNLNATDVSQVINQAHIGFMFAPMHHTLMKNVMPIRRDMAVRTIFNILGPLINPAKIKRQLVGVFKRDLTARLAQVYQQLGSTKTLVVHSDDGLDEISICAPTHMVELHEGNITSYTLNPVDYGFKLANKEQITVNNTQQSLAIAHAILNGEPSAANDMVTLNAGAGIYVSGHATTLVQGIEMAVLSINSGEALNAKNRYISATGQFAKQ